MGIKYIGFFNLNFVNRLASLFSKRNSLGIDDDFVLTLGYQGYVIIQYLTYLHKPPPFSRLPGFSDIKVYLWGVLISGL